ncbi:unnamed protein product [Eruca vesicaria subsp. sativa]|uniref:Uncharacterized protein n=1 Tax=Eruca vesicaria subsp. sativa TaxID=29727 RepID=A0ABC8KC26_ERUVS|nr:unnamed protein product [Eruca vesicaria subsp. sativa]
MSELISARMYSEDGVRLADKLYRRGNFKGALDILRTLTFVFPNTSTNHRKISQVHLAHEIHWRQFLNIVAKLAPERNKSVAAKLALRIINTAWMILCDPDRSRARNVEQGFRNMFREDEMHVQSVREGKRPCVDIIDTDSDSD